jgi:hypothetical protein
VIVLDTNVVSELVRPRPSGDVIAWVDAQLPWDLWLTSITAAELQAGAALLPAGKRRAAVVERVDALIGEMLRDSYCPSTSNAAPTTQRLSLLERARVCQSRRSMRPSVVRTTRFSLLATLTILPERRFA